MTQNQFYETLTYALLVLFALVATWPNKGRRQVGLVLFTCWVASNLIFWVLSYTWRPVIFPMLDVVFVLACYGARKETHECTPLLLIVLSILAIAANFAFSVAGGQTWDQLHRYEVALNIIFILQCLITGFWAGIEGVICRTGRLYRRTRRRRRDPQPLHPSRKND